ncbi:helix-turn-helix domain-containing protein [Streptomyces sp. NPDC006208]|uniref:helix-turn-helix domain-containing protein n=1 Tax=Streptomyces sp. NPDC006208 TaxID=3156734 RepID=UPI0033BD3DA3
MTDHRSRPPTGDCLAHWHEPLAGALSPSEARVSHTGDGQTTVRVRDLGAVRVSAVVPYPDRTRRPAESVRHVPPGCRQLPPENWGLVTVSQSVPSGGSRHHDVMLCGAWRLGGNAVCPGGGSVSTVHVQFPRTLIPWPSDRIDRITTVPLPALEGMGALLSQYVTCIVLDPSDYRPADAVRLGNVLVDLITALLAHHIAAGNAMPQESGRSALLVRIHAHIERSLGDPELSPVTIAAAHHLSVRSLHRLFADQGTTVSDWIRERRLERCRRELTDPMSRDMPIRTVAARWGYSSPAGFTRAFRTAYGLTPQEYRGQGAPSARTGRKAEERGPSL